MGCSGLGKKIFHSWTPCTLKFGVQSYFRRLLCPFARILSQSKFHKQNVVVRPQVHSIKFMYKGFRKYCLKYIKRFRHFSGLYVWWLISCFMSLSCVQLMCTLVQFLLNTQILSPLTNTHKQNYINLCTERNQAIFSDEHPVPFLWITRLFSTYVRKGLKEIINGNSERLSYKIFMFLLFLWFCLEIIILWVINQSFFFHCYSQLFSSFTKWYFSHIILTWKYK